MPHMSPVLCVTKGDLIQISRLIQTSGTVLPAFQCNTNNASVISSIEMSLLAL